MTKQTKIDKRITTIGDDDVGNDTKYEYICDWCNCLLVRLSSGNNSESWFCRRCQIPFEPSETQLRKKSKLGTQREELEPSVLKLDTNRN